jgi:uncharacterized protein DUF3592
MSKGRFLVFFGAGFGLIGVIFLGIAIVVAATTMSFQAKADRTGGTVTGMEARTSTHRDSDGHQRSSTAWYPTVRFTAADGRRYSFEGSTGSNPPIYHVGDHVAVAYDPAEPSDARIDTFGSTYLLPLIFGGLGAVFTSIGVPFLVAGGRRLRLRSWLRRHGHEVWAEVVDVGPDLSVRLNGRHPYVVRATWQDPQTGRTHTATSDYLRHDPGPRFTADRGVRVLFDPSDPERNFVDLGLATLA